ncbi:hypothetical protein GLYMA_10G245850v4 [Glycine max]|nr:hypothetical protein GLYMA_10G245850v4 [Glycine max]KAH1139926.1 hypothetical protein GYH30_029016 [Glycine max]
MKKQSVLSFSLALLVSFLHSSTTLAQLSPAEAPQQPLVPSLPQSPLLLLTLLES